MKLIKKNYFQSLISILILSLLFQNVIFINFFDYLKVSIFEILFIIFFLSLCFKYYSSFLKFLTDTNSYKLFEYIFIYLFFLKIIKFLLDINNQYNLYDLLIWIYIFILFKVFIFTLANKIISIKFLKNIFIIITLISFIVIIISFILYFFNIGENILWYKRESTYHPYFGSGSLHFYGFLKNYNLQAYLFIPGIIFILFSTISRNIKLLVLPITIIMILLIKSKVLLLLLGYLIFQLIIKKQILVRSKTISFSLFFFSLAIIYFIITHFVYIDINEKNYYDKSFFYEYYTLNPIFSFLDNHIYGTLFYKLKIMAINNAYENYFIYFNSINFNQPNDIYIEYSNGIDAHSDYFNYLSNYGLIGFLPFLVLFFYFFRFKFLNDKDNISIFYVYSLFIIESLISDVIHFQFIWILLAMLYYQTIYNLILNKT